MHRLRPRPVPPRPVFGAELRARAGAAVVAASAWLALMGGCGGGSIEAPPGLGLPPAPTTPAPAADAPLACVSQGSSVARTERVHAGLDRPWAMAFLPDQRVLVTQKSGSMVLVSADGAFRTTLAWDPLAGPQIRDGGQGGLLDLVLDPDYLVSGWIYFSYQEPGAAGQSGTAIARVRLRGNTLGDFQRLYQQLPKVAWDGNHFGSRLAFGADGTLFATLGDRMQDNPAAPTTAHAQDLGNSLGKIVRLLRDGRVPGDNPFVGRSGALPEIWSLGHRNPQGLFFDAASGVLWSTEHGPQGGDELNRIAPGGNYGWPLRSYGCPYGAPVGEACRVGGGVHAPQDGRSFVEPHAIWVPTSIAPSNLLVYRGTGFGEWQGQLLVAALAGQRLWRLELGGDARVTRCEALLGDLDARIRDLRLGPDGWPWILTDAGEIHRIRR